MKTTLLPYTKNGSRFVYIDGEKTCIGAFNRWSNKNEGVLCELYEAFLSESGATKHDTGCSFSEFCADLFRETEAGRAAIKACFEEI